MTEKRFNLVDLLETLAIAEGDECKYYQNNNDDFEKLCDLLNEYEDKYAKALWDYNGLGCEYDGLKQENEQLKRQISNLEHTKDFCEEVCADCERLEKENIQLKSSNLEYEDALGRLEEKNKQLKQRNTNQYNQLNQLWQLIEAKDWETLTAMDNQMKEDEEQLKREWRCYE